MRMDFIRRYISSLQVLITKTVNTGRIQMAMLTKCLENLMASWPLTGYH